MVRQSMITLLIVIVSLLTAWPVGAARQVEMDVILLVDTSASMGDELRALCRGIDDVVTELDERGVSANVVVLGITETRDCADQYITRLIPEGQTQDKEDWGLAVADLARHYEWTPDAERLIIPMSDEGPLQGDPVDDEDEGAIQSAIQAAQDNEAMVSPLMGTDFNSDVEPLAHDLAQQTKGQVFASKDPDDDLLDGLRDLVLAAADRTRPPATLLQAIPTPRDIALDGPVIGANLVLAILLTVILGVTSAVKQSASANRRAIRDGGRLGQLWAAVVDVGQTIEQWLSPIGWSRTPSRSRRLMAMMPWALFLVLLALMSVFLQPALNPLSWRGLGLWLRMLLALALVSLVYEGGQYWLARRAGATLALRVRPGTLLAALACIVLSRMAGFLPGYFYGRLAVCTASENETETDPPPQVWRQTALLGLAFVGVVGLSMWGLTLPTSLLLDLFERITVFKALTNLLSGMVEALQGFWLLGFFVAWQTLFFEMLPLQSTAGAALYRRNRLVWAVAAFVVLFVLLHTLLNPFGTAGRLLENGGVVLLAFALFLYSALTVALWVYSVRRPLIGAEEVVPTRQESWEQDQLTTVMAISLIVIWTLGACYGLTALVMGWLD